MDDTIVKILWHLGLGVAGLIIGFYAAYCNKKAENCAMKEDAQEINYESEKGKNLATKEDVKIITEKIESVKEYYSKDLENYKAQLQKEFEAHKYVLSLCHSLDNLLLKHISNCLKAEYKDSFSEGVNDNGLLSANIELAHFLSTYRSRYDNNQTIKKLRVASTDINEKYSIKDFQHYSDNEETYYYLEFDQKAEFIFLLNKTLNEFLPPLKL